MKTAICPGSFDPFTRGHLDIVRRAARLFDRVLVAVMVNSEKRCLFPPEERVRLIRLATAELPNVEVLTYDGLLASLCQEREVCAIVKGVRGTLDLENERMMAAVNGDLTGETVETVLLFSEPAHLHISSTVVREYLKYGLDCSGLLPEQIAKDPVLLAAKGEGKIKKI